MGIDIYVVKNATGVNFLYKSLDNAVAKFKELADKAVAEPDSFGFRLFDNNEREKKKRVSSGGRYQIPYSEKALEKVLEDTKKRVCFFLSLSFDEGLTTHSIRITQSYLQD